jgi:3-oxoacyl-[acyl-carrier-protein] synthase-3
MNALPRPQAWIVETGSYVPEKILTNSDLEKMVDTSDEWISTRTGMKERRIAAEGEYTSDMGLKAAQAALQKSGIDPLEIDLILVATLTPDHPFPSTACLIQTRLGATRAVAFDIQAACSGFVYGLSLAKGLVESGTYRTVLLVASEKLSSIVNYKDRNTCILFGDGAAACIIQGEVPGAAIDKTKDRSRWMKIHDISLGADGAQAELLIQPAGGSKCPASAQTVADCLHFIHMEGKEVFKHAVRRMEGACKESLEKAGFQEDQAAWLIPHQANMRIIEALAKRFNVSMEKVFITIHKYGNTSASSVGIALDEFRRDIPIVRGEPILLAAFGAGLTWGAGVLTYVKEERT